MIYTIVLVATAIAALVDLKKREVPDTISIGLIILGIINALVLSIMTSNYKIIIYSIAAGAILFGLGYILYRRNIWGGGDVKLLTGFGTCFAWSTLFLFKLIFLIFICGAIYGLIYRIIQYKGDFRKAIFVKNHIPFVPAFVIALIVARLL